VKRILNTVFLVFSLMLGATACAAAPAALDFSEDTIIIDVRTPAEFKTGHLQGALNIDVQSPDFYSQISELDPNADYFIYCRSGNRSAQAMRQMAPLGFSSMTNGGSVQEATERSGVPVVLD
jgi:rhodanese-related sulfurtransferase